MKEVILAMLFSTGVNADYELRLMQIIVPVNMNGKIVEQSIYVPSVVANDLKVGEPKINKVGSAQ